MTSTGAEDEEPMEAWQQFRGTELGGLMSQLYGGNKPKINYPRPVQRRNSIEDRKKFIPGGASATATDPRKVTRRSVDESMLQVPKVATMRSKMQQRGSSIKPIDYVARRKGADIIKSEIEDIQLRQTRYRPAHVKPISTDIEKDRLGQIFSFKGGKGLPEELTNPTGVAPFELQEQRRQREQQDAVRIRRGLQPRRQSGGNRMIAAPLSESEQLAEQVQCEIDERRQHLEEMRQLGVKINNEASIKSEIARKVRELEDLMAKDDCR